MSKENFTPGPLTCKDCKYSKSPYKDMDSTYCFRTMRHFKDIKGICAHFETTGGKSPRFCLYASSIDAMARGILEHVEEVMRQFMKEHGTDVPKFSEEFYKDVIEDEKEWLMGFPEDGKTDSNGLERTQTGGSDTSDVSDRSDNRTDETNRTYGTNGTEE